MQANERTKHGFSELKGILNPPVTIHQEFRHKIISRLSKKKKQYSKWVETFFGAV